MHHQPPVARYIVIPHPSAHSRKPVVIYERIAPPEPEIVEHERLTVFLQHPDTHIRFLNILRQSPPASTFVTTEPQPVIHVSIIGVERNEHTVGLAEHVTFHLHRHTAVTLHHCLSCKLDISEAVYRHPLFSNPLPATVVHRR